MDVRSQMRPAAEAAAAIVMDIREEELDAPTPCAGWDVRTLINHLILWSGDRKSVV